MIVSPVTKSCLSHVSCWRYLTIIKATVTLPHTATVPLSMCVCRPISAIWDMGIPPSENQKKISRVKSINQLRHWWIQDSTLEGHISALSSLPSCLPSPPFRSHVVFGSQEQENRYWTSPIYYIETLTLHKLTAGCTTEWPQQRSVFCVARCFMTLLHRRTRWNVRIKVKTFNTLSRFKTTATLSFLKQNLFTLSDV